MRKMKIPGPGAAQDKYRFHEMKAGAWKDFPVKNWKAVRDAVSRANKKNSGRFVSRKLLVDGKEVIRVYREG